MQFFQPAPLPPPPDWKVCILCGSLRWFRLDCAKNLRLRTIGSNNRSFVDLDPLFIADCTAKVENRVRSCMCNNFRARSTNFPVWLPPTSTSVHKQSAQFSSFSFIHSSFHLIIPATLSLVRGEGEWKAKEG